MMETTQKRRRVLRRKRKGLEDKNAQKEGEMYTPGGFDAGEPGPSKHARMTVHYSCFSNVCFCVLVFFCNLSVVAIAANDWFIVHDLSTRISQNVLFIPWDIFSGAKLTLFSY